MFGDAEPSGDPAARIASCTLAPTLDVCSDTDPVASRRAAGDGLRSGPSHPSPNSVLVGSRCTLNEGTAIASPTPYGSPWLRTRLSTPDGELSLLSTFTTFRVPLDISVESLRIEHLIPADVISRSRMMQAHDDWGANNEQL